MNLAVDLQRLARRWRAPTLALVATTAVGAATLAGLDALDRAYPPPLDLPATAATFALLDALDRSVVAAGGRLYLAKDARQSRDTFEAGYPALPAFRDLRRRLGADGVLASRLSARLGL